ncbi:MAG: hypothetical protein ACRD8W_07250 [Nitrososphaeraceae archaeon]
MIVVVMIAKENPQEVDDDLIYADEYLGTVGTPKTDYTKRLRVRRLICRVCKLKFRTRQETQEHIRREHRRV